MDRASLSDAKRVGARLLGDHEERAVALDLFTDAVLGAAAAAPGSWVVTLFPRAIRISVGRLLVLELLEETLWLVVLDDAPGVADLARWRLDDKGFVVLPNPHHSLQIPGKELPGLATELRAAFAPTMAAAAATAGRSSYRNAWAPGAFQMLEEHSGRELPVPSWLGELEASRWWLAPWPSAGLPALAGDGPRPGDAVFLGDAARPLLLDETRIIRIRDGGIDLTPPVVRDAAVPIREKVTGWRQLSVEDLERLGMVSPSDALPTVRFDFEASEVARVIEATRTPSLSRIDLARWRSAFTSRFGQDRLRATDGVDLLELLHGRPSHDSLVYWLEFKEDEQFSNSSFGSIRGGSALKFGLFQRAETQDWVTGSSSAMTALSEAEAVDLARRQRDEILAADAVLASLPEDPTDPAWADLGKRIQAAAPSIAGLAFAHKTLSLWRPEKVDAFQSTAYQAHVLASLGVAPPPTLYDAARVLVALLQLLRLDLPELDMTQLCRALRDLYGAPIGHWRVGTTDGQNRDHWPQMEKDACVAIGWEELGDLDDLLAGLSREQAIEALKTRLADMYPTATPSVRGRSAVQIWNFYGQMQEGDLVYAANGLQVRGVGTVAGPYRYIERADGFHHRRPVRWLTTTTFVAPTRNGLRTTVFNLQSVTELHAAAKRQIVAHPATDPVAVRVVAERAIGPIEQQLHRKGQVILYGPPGTGKTYHAIQAAQEVIAYEVFGRPWALLAQSEKRQLEGRETGAQRIWVCTFHPAYSYEDFVEGLRPVVSEGGHLTFAPKPGLFRRICAEAARAPEHHFVLLIDEFNRGDAPRIFGELLTLLELDKREKVTVVLPTSGEAFSVPRNLWIIATMNTADRSIALLDAALRRRFAFLEYLPDPTVLGDSRAAGLRLADLLDVLNRRLVATLGDAARNLQIGHAYLMGPGNVQTLRTAFQYDILPLLQEYCGDAPDTLERLLGPKLYDRHARTIRREPFQVGREDVFLDALIDLDRDTLVTPDEEAAETSDEHDAEADA